MTGQYIRRIETIRGLLVVVRIREQYPSDPGRAFSYKEFGDKLLEEWPWPAKAIETGDLVVWGAHRIYSFFQGFLKPYALYLTSVDVLDKSTQEGFTFQF